VWVSYYNATDVNHGASAVWLQQQLKSRSPLVAPTLVLPEVGGAIARRVDRAKARQVINNLRSLTSLVMVGLDEPLYRLAATLAIDLQLRGADAVYVAVARHLNIPLVTWDKEMINRTSGLIQVFTP
jgi:predicted nucleic acid-binding protein